MDTALPLIAICALLCAAAALIFSLTAAVRLRRQERIRMEIRTLTLIREMRSRLRQMLTVYREAPENRQVRKNYEEAAADLADAYEDLCRRFYAEKTEERWFFGLYGRELVSWVEQGPMRSAFRQRRPAYPQTARVYRELQDAYSRRDPAMERFFASVHLNKEQQK